MGYPPILIFQLFRRFIFPMADYLGETGCFLIALYLAAFISMYTNYLPLEIALVRYLFVVRQNWIKRLGVNRVVNTILILSIILPLFIATSTQYPISDYIHGQYYNCIGRFDAYFNPTHPDPITPGRRKGKSYCEDALIWANDPDVVGFQHFLRQVQLFNCQISFLASFCVMLSLPEMLLYLITFRQITKQTNETISSGILKPEVIKTRRRQNTLNIYMTFWTWIIQFITNLVFMVLATILPGTTKFKHLLSAVLHLSLSFNVMPILYISFADEDIKSALAGRQFFVASKLFFKSKA